MKKISLSIAFLLQAALLSAQNVQVQFFDGTASYGISRGNCSDIGAFNVDNDLTFFLDFNGIAQSIKTNNDHLEFSDCHHSSSRNLDDFTMNASLQGGLGSFVLTAWQDNCGSRFIYNKQSALHDGSNCGGDPHCGSGCGISGDSDYDTSDPFDIDLNAYPPEKIFPFFINAGGHYTISYSTKYSFPKLTSPASSTGETRYCSDKELTLVTSIPSVINKTGVRYIWKYAFSGSSNFVVMDTTADSTITFRPLDRFPVLNTAQYMTPVMFVVEGLNVDGHSGQSDIAYFELAPKAPVAQFVTGYQSCQDENTGSIGIRDIIRATPDNRFLLRSGLNDTLPCDLNNITTCFPVTSGSFSATGYDITSLAPGAYTLWLINSGGAANAQPNSDHGACYSWYNVVIDTLPRIVHKIDSTRNLSCYQSADGAVFLHCKKTQAPFTFRISPQAGVLLQNDTLAAFNNLPAGTYYINVTDYCNHPTARDTVVITQPAPLAATAQVTAQAACFLPSDGAAAVTATGAPAYNYRLEKDGLPADSLLNASLGTWALNGLPPASYTYSVQDASRPQCPLMYGGFTISAPDVLQAQVSVQPVSCNGGNDGSIITTASGGMQNNYSFRLYQGATQLAINNSGAFGSLPAGSYSVVVRNNSAACQDSFTVAGIQVAAPAPLAAVVTKTNVSCSGGANGAIAAAPSGGTPPYTFRWQFLAGTTWADYTMSGQGTGAALSGLFPTSYRTIITDAHQCVYVTPAESVQEPNALTIDSVARHHIVCFAGNGSLHVYASGGMPPYQLSISADNGATFVPYDNDSLLYAGSYLVAIADNGGCALVYPQALVISQPPAPLVVQPGMAWYNGYQVPCYGDSATASFSVSGGNGLSFSGYVLSLDGGPFSADTLYHHLPAGIHMVTVRDGRGCQADHPFEVRQPQQLILQEASNTGTLCINTPTGSVSVTAQGGAAPYTFASGNSLYTSQDSFVHLYPGNYSFKVKDGNGCVDSLPVSVASIYPALTLHQDITPVSCYGLADGGFHIAADGGAGAAWNYQWLKGGFAPNITLAHNLPADTFRVKVTDQAGCTDTFTVRISQPDTVLYQHLYVQAVCPGNAGGRVVAHAAGGTPPYLFALGSSAYAPDSAYIDLQPGKYSFTVKDSRGCIAEDTFSIKPLSQPQVRFLVASKEYAGDTLVLVDVSRPAADSVHWAFPQGTTVYRTGLDSAWVSYTDTGSYNVTMSAYYSNCIFDLTKDIRVTPGNDTPSDPGNEKEILLFSVSPNPTTGEVQVKVDLNRQQRYLHLQLMDALGQELWQTTVTDVRNYEGSIGALQGRTSGTYFLVAITAAAYEKVIIVKQ